MILAVNIGNTNIRVAVKNSQTVFYTRENFDAAFFISEVESGLGAEIWAKITGSMVASVVPKNTEIITNALEEKTKNPVKRVNVRNCGALKTEKYNGLLGDDRAVCCAMALKNFAPPFIVVDCGTATTINVVNESGEFLGGAILTGLQTGINALSESTAQLPLISNLMENTEIKIIGGNTAECILSGAVIGLAGAIDGFVNKVSESLRCSAKVIITGGHAPIILPHLCCEFTHRPSLLLDGLFYLFEN
jgi:type III pantothenate kinase